jgi:hypothetical protein
LTSVNVDISDIQFLLAGNKVGKHPDINLVLIDSAFHNYNLVLEMWKLRDRTQADFLEAARRSGAAYLGDGSIEGDIDSLVMAIGQDNVDLLVHTGEKLVQTIDAALDQLAESLDQLQTHASKKIDRKLVPEPMVAHYYLARNSIERKMVEIPTPDGEWVKTPYYEKPIKRYPERERLMAETDLPEFEENEVDRQKEQEQ